MTAMIFQVMRMLDEEGVPFAIMRTRDNGITLIATTVGRRIELFVDEDDMVDVTVFIGNEDVAVGLSAVRLAIADVDN